MRFSFCRRFVRLFLLLAVCMAIAAQPLAGQAQTSWMSQLTNWATTATSTFTSTAPAAPSGLAGQFDGQQRVRLTWRDNAGNESSQQLFYGTDGRNFTRLATVGANVTSFTHDLGGPPRVSAYYYTVRAVNSAGNSGTSNIVKVALTTNTSTQPTPTPAPEPTPTPTPSPEPTAPSQPSSMAVEVLNEVNKFRAQNGLPALQLDDRLIQAAQRHSDDMAARRTLSHSCKDGTTLGQRVTQSGYTWRTVAENVGSGQTTAQQVVQAWINSSGHRANMLNSRVKDIGVGYNNRYWTLDLAG